MNSATAIHPPIAPRDIPWWRRDRTYAGLLVVAVILVYSRTWSAGFIWDDDLHVTTNPCIVGPLGLKEIWTSASANYFPLVLTNLWVQHAVWGLNPAPYHVVDMAMHAAAAVLLGLVLRRLNIPGAWLGAALWALHPVQVESVAWISEQKNTQSAIFFLLAIWFYLKWRSAEENGGRFYGLALGCGLAAYLSKSSTVMLPAVLVLCDWWQTKTWSWRRCVPVLPLFALSALAGAWTVWEQRYHSFAAGPEWNLSLMDRAGVAGRAVWFYFGKLVWPQSLVFNYPRWPEAASVAGIAGLIAAVGLLLLTWRARTKAMAALFFAGAYFLALLFPILGFFNVYYFRYSFVADHFQYLASIGPLALLGASLGVLLENSAAGVRKSAALFSVASLFTLAGLSWHETSTFSDLSTLWRTTLRRNPDSWLATTMVGNAATDAGRLDDGLRLQRRALQLNPRSFEAHYNLGLALVKLGKIDDGIEAYQRALALKPTFAEAENNLGVAFAATNRLPEAIEHYRRAVQLNPWQPESHFLLALALTLTGHPVDALPEYATALKLRPRYPEAEYALARTLESVGRAAEAVAHYRSALAARADFFDAHAHLAAALFRQGDSDGAAEQFEAATKLRPNDANLRCDYGTALLSAKRTLEAIRQFETAVQLAPQFAIAHYNLALALRAVGRFDESDAHDRTAHRLQPNLPPLPPVRHSSAQP